MEEIGYNKTDIKVVYEINKTTEIVVDTAIGKTVCIEITELVKQASKSKVNYVGEKVHYKYGEIEIGMSVYMDDISVAGEPKKEKNKEMCKMKVEKQMKYRLSKTKYMVVKIGKEKEEGISEQVKAENIQRTKKCKYLGITINEEGNLKGTLKN